MSKVIDEVRSERSSCIMGIEYYVPDAVLSNEEICDNNSKWTPDEILNKTGIAERHIAGVNECSSDLAVKACNNLFDSLNINREDIQYVILCTQSPDYFLPSTACLLQDRLNLTSSVGAIDVNQGCSGYVYGLSLAKGLIESEQVENVLLITAETYSKYIREDDNSVRTLFGDAASASFIRKSTAELRGHIGPFIFGTDGGGCNDLIVKSGAARANFNSHDEVYITMNGPKIFTFTLQVVKKTIEKLLTKNALNENDIDFYIFHQANRFMLESLRSKCGIPKEKFIIDIKEFGNTVSSTIPIALTRAIKSGEINRGQKIMLVGFGVGLSWAACIVDI